VSAGGAGTGPSRRQLLADNGSIVARHWRLVHETGPDAEPDEPQVTTLDHVFDEYLETYEQHTLVPIAQTSLGNISLHPVVQAL
jgi:hypothetical protein